MGEEKRFGAKAAVVAIALVVAPMFFGFWVPLALDRFILGPPVPSDRAAFAIELLRAGGTRDASRVVAHQLRVTPNEPLLHELRVRTMGSSTCSHRRVWREYVGMSAEPERHDLGWFARAWILLLDRDDPAGALEALAEVHDEGLPGLAFARAKAYAELGRDRRVDEALWAALPARDHYSERAREMLTERYLARGEWRAAASLYAEAAELPPPYDAAALLREGRVGEALRAALRPVSSMATPYACFVACALLGFGGWLRRRAGRLDGATRTVFVGVVGGGAAYLVSSPLLHAAGVRGLASFPLGDGAAHALLLWVPLVAACALHFAALHAGRRATPSRLGLAGASVGLGVAAAWCCGDWSAGRVFIGIAGVSGAWPALLALGGMLALAAGEAKLRRYSMPVGFFCGAMLVGLLLYLGVALASASAGAAATLSIFAAPVSVALFSGMWHQVQALDGSARPPTLADGVLLSGFVTWLAVSLGVAIALALPDGHRSAQRNVQLVWMIGMSLALLIAAKTAEPWTPDWPRQWWRRYREQSRKKPPPDPPTVF